MKFAVFGFVANVSCVVASNMVAVVRESYVFVGYPCEGRPGLVKVHRWSLRVKGGCDLVWDCSPIVDFYRRVCWACVWC